MKHGQLRQPHGTPVYLEILGRIQRGEVSLGEKLVDTSLANALKVSRMPVREALLRLVHEGYLVGTTRGFMLPELSQKDILEIFEVRRLIEPRAAGAAAFALDEFGLAALEAAYSKARLAITNQDDQAFMDANTRFRQTWLQSVPNDRLANTISRFVDHVQTIRMATLHDQQSQRVAMALLDELIVGFRNRDSLGVHDCMARFIDQARDRFFALLPMVQAAAQTSRI